MMAEVAAQTGRTPRQVYREESVRTMFMTWASVENGRARPIQMLLDAFLPDRSADAPAGPLPGGKGDTLPEAARRAAERAAASGKPPARPAASAGPTQAGAAPPGAPADPDRARKEAWWAKVARRRAEKLRRGPDVRGNTVAVHIDDPGAMAAYAGSHPEQRRIAAEQGISLGKVRRGG